MWSNHNGTSSNLTTSAVCGKSWMGGSGTGVTATRPGVCCGSSRTINLFGRGIEVPDRVTDLCERAGVWYGCPCGRNLEVPDVSWLERSAIAKRRTDGEVLAEA